MKLSYIDIHSHLNLSPLLETKEVVLAKMKEEGVGTITVGVNLAISREGVELAHQHPDLLWATVGIHPIDGGDELFDERIFEELAQDPKVVAIGETGLDYFRDQSEDLKKKQTELFKQHIQLANKINKPLMLHVRASKGSDDAYYDALKILKAATVRANFHFFSGSQKCMEDIVAAGFTISVDGPITFSKDYDDMIKAVPLDKVMIETDAPFAAPAPYRGKPCEPWMVIEIARKIAELKGLDLEVVRVQVLNNSAQFFGLDL